jgi:hypothetical protein
MPRRATREHPPPSLLAFHDEVEQVARGLRVDDLDPFVPVENGLVAEPLHPPDLIELPEFSTPEALGEKKPKKRRAA